MTMFTNNHHTINFKLPNTGSKPSDSIIKYTLLVLNCLPFCVPTMGKIQKIHGYRICGKLTEYIMHASSLG